jgi:potassium-transporting ATPase KdpC subunit
MSSRTLRSSPTRNSIPQQPEARAAGLQGEHASRSPAKGAVAVALRATLVTLVLLGLVYPLAVTAVAQVVFPGRANGSLVKDEHQRLVGSELIGQGFTSPAYFQPRPSAAGSGFDATSSSGSNLGPTSKKLRDGAQALLDKLRAANPDAPASVPTELVTASGSGLDPHLSLEAAVWQVPRIAKARQVAPERVRSVIDEVAEGRDLGVLGEPRVNALLLNLALDRHFGQPPAGAPGTPSQK